MGGDGGGRWGGTFQFIKSMAKQHTACKDALEAADEATSEDSPASCPDCPTINPCLVCASVSLRFPRENGVSAIACQREITPASDSHNATFDNNNVVVGQACGKSSNRLRVNVNNRVYVRLPMVCL